MIRKKIECSIYKHEGLNKPCVVYSHSHSGNKSEGALLFEHLAEEFNLVIFDYTGYGYSEKDHCTLGLKEQDDLESVINYVKTKYNIEHIYIWARSMGAVTALLLANRTRNNICKGMIIDSPFTSTKDMVRLVIIISYVMSWKMSQTLSYICYSILWEVNSKLKLDMT